MSAPIAEERATEDEGPVVAEPGCTFPFLRRQLSTLERFEAALQGRRISAPPQESAPSQPLQVDDHTGSYNNNNNNTLGSHESNGTNNGNNEILPDELPIFAALYDKELLLRSGSFGTVYTCRHKKYPNTTYAVKIMDRKKLKQKDVNAVFREVRILLELTTTSSSNGENVHIIQLIDFFVETKQLYMVTVFAAGGDCFDRLTSRKRYTEKNARDLARNLLQTIQFLHTHHPHPIVHRDLKPENLLLRDSTNDSHILLADFGFARHLKQNEKCLTRCGTPSFVSPEILLGLPYGVTVDLWSIGCLLYMLVAGCPPFQDPHHRALFRKIRAGDFVFHNKHWENVSVQAKQLVAHLLTVNVKNRWTAEEALACDWFRNMSDMDLEKHDLSGSLDEMKAFQPKNAWKRAVQALGFCATAPFWKPDMLSFSQQMSAWDDEASHTGVSSTSGSTAASSILHRMPTLKFGDRYQLESKLRKGSQATVWKCVHKQTQTVYAVKIIKRVGLDQGDDEGVLNEVAVMQSLSGNKYVVQLLDFYEEEEFFYLVMDYCGGGDVFDRIVKYTQYTEGDAQALATTLLKAVASLHNAGLAHRDIKPQNLFLLSETDNANIHIGDYGFAKRVHTPESLTSRVGTPTYVAPEILKNLPHDERVDLWSVGIVIFVLLVGYPPFLEEDQTELFRKIRSGDWVFYKDDWKHVSEDAKDLIRGLLVVDPKDRWTIEQCLECKWIGHDPAQLSEINLSESLRVIREKKSRLRSFATQFTGMGDTVQSVQVATQAQEGFNQHLCEC